MNSDGTMDQGASPSGDRAVVNGAGQAVSALRASVPSAAIDAARSELDRLSTLLYPEPFGCSKVSVYAADLYALVHGAESASELLEALEEARSILAHSGAESGYCMCGDPVDSHAMAGHSPVDAHTYTAGRLVEKIDALVARARA